MNKTIDAVSPVTMEALVGYSWLGNIRELQNVIERAVVVHEKGNLVIKRCWLARNCFQIGPATHLFRGSAIEERRMIGAALAEMRGRVSGPSGAAAKLGIPPSTLEPKIRAMNINKYSFRISEPNTAPRESPYSSHCRQKPALNLSKGGNSPTWTPLSRE
jgi:formate hydrogenlyase transcriptional activator